jgi:hypothetical protein
MARVDAKWKGRQIERSFDMIAVDGGTCIVHRRGAQLTVRRWTRARAAVEESGRTVDADRLSVDAENTRGPQHVAAYPQLQPQHLVVWG